MGADLSGDSNLPQPMLFSTDVVPQQERFAYWREALCVSFEEMLPERSSDDPFMGRLMPAGMVAGTALVRANTSQHTIHRGRAEIARSLDPGYFIHKIRRGRYDLTLNGRHVVATPGDMVFLDCNPSDIAIADGLDATIVRIPRDSLHAVLPGAMGHGGLMVSRSSDVGALLWTYLGGLEVEAHEMDAAAGERAQAQLCALTAAAFGRLQSDDLAGGVAAARLRRLNAFMRGSLDDAELTAAVAAAWLGVSERYVNKLFERTGRTFGETLTLMRLQSARARLEDPAEASRTIADIAFDCGFADLSTFNRRFKQAFGVTPRTVRNPGEAPPPF